MLTYFIKAVLYRQSPETCLEQQGLAFYYSTQLGFAFLFCIACGRTTEFVVPGGYSATLLFSPWPNW